MFVTNRKKIVYHEALPDTFGLRHSYNDAMSLYGEYVNMHHKYLFRLTDLLLSSKQIFDTAFSL